MARKIRSARKAEKHSWERALFVLGFLIVVLGVFLLIGSFEIGQEVTEAPLPAPGDAVCGNGLIEAGENCGNCFLDVRCLSDEVCVQGFCMEKKTSFLPITLSLIFLALVGIFFISYKLFQRKKGVVSVDTQRIGSLIDYTYRSLRAGNKGPEIRISALRAGWSKRDIKKAFREANKRLRI